MLVGKSMARLMAGRGATAGRWGEVTTRAGLH
jgi:hypothetical protein